MPAEHAAINLVPQVLDEGVEIPDSCHKCWLRMTAAQFQEVYFALWSHHVLLGEFEVMIYSETRMECTRPYAVYYSSTNYEVLDNINFCRVRPDDSRLPQWGADGMEMVLVQLLRFNRLSWLGNPN